MATLTFNGTTFTVDHAVKGANYIHGYGANGQSVVSIDGITDFSQVHYDGTYMLPGECLEEVCNSVMHVGDKLVRRDGAEILPGAIGAAPHGYGLGKKTEALPLVRTKEEVDALIHAGWYEYYNVNVQCCGYPGTQYGGILVVPSMHAYTQIFFCRNYYEGYLIRRYDGTAWKDWEWVNPPMFENAEYRTTERWNGKPVYRKLVKYTSVSDIGSNSSYTDINIPHGISGFKSLVRCNVVCNADSNLPFVSQSGNVTAMTRIDATNVCIRIVNDVWSTPTFVIDIAYIKE